MDPGVYVLVGFSVFFIAVIVIVRFAVNKASDAIENKYARYKNEKNVGKETKLSDLHNNENDRRG